MTNVQGKPRLATQQWELLFNSGFGGTTRLAAPAGPYFHGPKEQYEDLIGADPSKPSPNAWDDISRHPNLGNLRIYYEGGDASQRSARIVADEFDPSKKFLRFWLGQPNITINWPTGPEHKARVQAELYGNTNLREFYQTVRLRFNQDFQELEKFPGTFHWLTLFEFWNQPFWNDYPFPFRITIGLTKPTAGPSNGLFFHVEAQKMLASQKFETIWHEEQRDLAVPYGKWMTLELYYREGRQDEGRVYFAVTPDGQDRQVIFDVRNFTHHPDNPSPAGVTHFNPMKVYTSATLVDFLRGKGKSMQVDWGDLAFWKGRQPPGVTHDLSNINP